MRNRCRRSILCLVRRGRCCLGGAIVLVIVLHFRCLRIDLSSAEALIEGRLHQLLETHSESGLPSLLRRSSTKPTGAALSHSSRHRICTPQTPVFLQARQLPKAVWWPDLKRERSSHDSSLRPPPLHLPHSRLPAPQHSHWLHRSSSYRFLVRYLVSSEGIVDWDWDPQKLHGPALLSQWPQDAPQFPHSSHLRSYKRLTVCDLSYTTSILRSSQSPRRLLRCHGFRLKRAISATRWSRPRAQLVSSLLHHHTSASLLLLPGHGAIRLYHQPATTPSFLQCSLRYLSLMCFRTRFLALV